MKMWWYWLFEAIDSDPEGTLKALQIEREFAPPEDKRLYDGLILSCKLKIIAKKRNMSVLELIDEALKNYVNTWWGVVMESEKK